MFEQMKSWTIEHAEVLTPWFWTFAVFLISFFILLAVKRIVWKRLIGWSKSAAGHVLAYHLIESINGPLSGLILVGALGIAQQTTPAAFRSNPAPQIAIKVALIMIAMWVVDRVALVLFTHQKSEKFSKSTKSLVFTIARIILASFGLLIILDTLGISITPLLASLGVGSVAVALAAQDTLSNLFGGIYVLVDEPVRLGDFVRLEDGVEGNVEKIGWRSTRILAPNNSMIIVPNSKLASARMTNFDHPNKEQGFAIEIGVSYDCDLNKVETVAIEVAKKILGSVTGGIPEFQPVVRFIRFGESSIDFSLGLRCKQFSDQFLIKHELIKALHTRFKAEGIDIPYPHRVIKSL